MSDDDATGWGDDEGDPGVEPGRAGAVLTYLAEHLVEEPDAVRVVPERARNGGTKLSLHVAQGDMGKVIGRRGRVAQSIRTLVRAAGASEERDVIVDIVD